jgi:peroxiredoxin
MKKHSQFIVLLLCSIISLTVNAKQLATISGKVTSPRVSSVKLSMYADLITFEPMEYDINLDANNSFTLDVPVMHATVATLSHGNSKIEVYLEPGDKLKTEFHGWDLKATVLFSGKGAENNYYLNKSARKFQKLSDEHITYQMSHLKPDAFKKYMDKMRQRKLAFLDKFEGELKFSKQFEAYAQADIHYWWAHHLMQYRWEHAFYNDIAAPMELPEPFFAFLNEIETSNDNAVTNIHYLYFLDQYLEYKGSVDIRYNKYGAPIKEDFRGAKRFLKGRAMYYVLANEIHIKCQNKNTYSIGNEVSEFLANCEDEEYKTLVKADFASAKGLASGTPAPNFKLVDTNSEEVSLSDFRGKVVYLDFWATWCAPCTYELLNSKGLKSQFKDKDVVFLYISLDTNMDSWRSFLQRHNLDGVHVYAQGIYDSEVANQYSVRGLPSFFLIDKDGNLARVPAKRSSETGVYEEIEDVLTK